MALTPEQLAGYLKDQQAGYYTPNGEWISQSTGSYTDPSGMQVGGFNAAGASQQFMDMLGQGDSKYIYGNGKEGDQYNVYDAAGEDTGRTGNYAYDNFGKDLLMALALVGGVGAAGGVFGAGGVAGAGAAGGGAAMGAGGSGAIGTMAPLELLPTTMGDYALPGLMGTAGAAGAGGAGGGLLSGLGGKALGVGASLLGGLAGSQGQESSQTTQRDIPEWLKPYVTGENGILPMTQQQLASSRSPERMAEWANIRNTGMGLLNRPQVSNPTAGWSFGR